MHNFIKSFDFYGDAKRNFNSKQIEDDLNKLDSYYEVIWQQKDFFLRNFSGEGEDRLDFNEMSQQLLAKFDRYVEAGMEELRDIFNNLSGEPAGKINLLIKQLTIMKSRVKEYRFINGSKVRETNDKIHRYISAEF